MQDLINKVFPNRGESNLHLVLMTAIAAYVLQILGLTGWSFGFGLIFQVILIGLLVIVTYAVARFLLPGLSDPDDKDDVLGNWLAIILFFLAGAASFGLMFALALVVSFVVIYLRSPEVLASVPLVGQQLSERA